MVFIQVETSLDNPFWYENFNDLLKVTINFYNNSHKKATTTPEVCERRAQISNWIHKFHQECGTLTPYVEDAIEKLQDGSCLFLMTAHQPNLFAYSGVLRKATLNYVLAQKLSKILNIPVISFFGIADQDFTDDRWVKSALLPDVERRGGVLELRYNMTEKVMLNKVAKPSQQILDNWRSTIISWFNGKLNSVRLFCKSLGIESSLEDNKIVNNFEDFWRVVEEAQARADNYSDFNAFIMSKIINDVWGYDTLFSRFSECQQVFESEFCFLLSNFNEYSRYVKEITSSEKVEGGVYEHECDTLPFWYHCDCGGKVRLMAEDQDRPFVGHGRCLCCKKEYRIDFHSKREPKISGILSKISARSLSMPMVFFDGLKVCSYVGGVGGKGYLRQAKYVAERLGIAFPPVVIWRPKDLYLGVGQLDALMRYEEFSGTFDLSKYSEVMARLRDEISRVDEEVEELELKKESIIRDAGMKKEDKNEKIKAISIKQTKIRKESDFPVLVRNLRILENVDSVMRLHPCMVDYAVNIGLKSTSEQWLAFLMDNGRLTSDVSLQSDFDDLFQLIESRVRNQ